MEEGLQATEGWMSGDKDAEVHNLVLLGKWLRWFRMEKDCLWKKVISNKYGLVSKWEPKEMRFGHVTGIKRVCCALQIY